MRRRPAEGAVLHVTARHCGRAVELQGRCKGREKKRRASDAARDALPRLLARSMLRPKVLRRSSADAI
jgi:hypothetical protein